MVANNNLNSLKFFQIHYRFGNGSRSRLMAMGSTRHTRSGPNRRRTDIHDERADPWPKRRITQFGQHFVQARSERYNGESI